ncbi:hypothetical protein NIES267_08150 [Calothrix parasitica NIES-267]|uniref:Uncharacterized protein n=1 Tax=Calothrix parasitica NIES-267 TaxID=1973488 RepID=A0A1Z4LJI1_9CYAN|nr:hypothetical protein NIES267_08150 [Calothrix parasitica NIES-267]
MKPYNKELFANLKWFTQGLTFPDDERGSLNPFVWDVSERGELTAEKLMLSNNIWGNKSLKRIEFDDYWGKSRANKQTTVFIETLQSHLTEIQIYRAYFPDDGFSLHTGKTNYGDWFGLCSPFDSHGQDYSGRTSEQFNIKNNSPSQQILNLVEELQNNSFPLTNQYARYQSKWMWQYSDTKDKLIEKLMDSVKFFTTQNYKNIFNIAARYANELAAIEAEIEYYSFYNNQTSYYDEETGIEYELDIKEPIEYEYPPGQDYRELDNYLKSTLNDLRVYTVGANSSCNFHIYVLGKTQYDDWAGVLIDVQLNR